MRLRETQTMWGNMYRRKYFLNGKRISEEQADSVFEKHHKPTTKSRQWYFPGGFSTEWDYDT